MARSSKTQQPDDAVSPPDPAQIARHFMQLWQDQWQNLAQHMPTGDAGGTPFPASFAPLFTPWQEPWRSALSAASGFPAPFGHNQTDALPSPPRPDPTAAAALELATAAVAASEQCLELLKRCAQRLDELEQRAAVVRPARAKRSAHSAAAKRPRAS